MLRRLFTVLPAVALFALLAPAFILASNRLHAEDASEASPPPASSRSSSQQKAEKMLGGGPDKITLTPEERQFTELTNTERVAHKLHALTVAPLLVLIAREKSKEMHDLNYWGHTSPVKEKQTAMLRLLYSLPEPPVSMIVGENLYYCSEVRVEAGHQALMNSPTHRANILKPDYDSIGIGTYTASDGRFWTTEIFLTIEY